MCSRFEQHVQKMRDWTELLDDWPSDAERRLSIKPTDTAGTVDAEGYKERSWWLIPRWSKDPVQAKKYPMFNAKAETVTEKPSFRDPWKRSQRCIVPASAYFEWTPVPGQKKKQCKRIALKPGEPLLLAGLWETWGHDADQRDTFTIITCDPLPDIAHIHYRMPLMLRVEELDVWLHGAPDEAEALLNPHQVGHFDIEAVENP